MQIQTSKTNKPFFSIIILNYNGLKFLDACIKSVINSDYPAFEIIILDNASKDKSLERIQSEFGTIPNIKIIKSKQNLGFAEGNNVGSKYATGDYLIFLNIDTIVDRQWLTELSNAIALNPNIGAAQCKLLLMDNPELFDSTGHFIDWFGLAYVRGHKKRDTRQYESTENIFGATGAAMLMKNDLFKRIGGFDKDFFLLFEESDLCWRTWLSGFQVVYVPKAKVYHKSGEIRSKDGQFRNLYLSRKNRMTSMLKNYGTKNLILFFPVHIVLMNAIALFTQDKLEYLKAVFYAEKNALLDIKITLKKRRFIQSAREVSDKQLFNEGLIRKPTIREMLENGF